MKRLALALLVVVMLVPGAVRAEECEDELGNLWTLPLDQYQASMRPQGACLPVGTWSRFRNSGTRTGVNLPPRPRPGLGVDPDGIPYSGDVRDIR